MILAAASNAAGTSVHLNKPNFNNLESVESEIELLYVVVFEMERHNREPMHILSSRNTTNTPHIHKLTHKLTLHHATLPRMAPLEQLGIQLQQVELPY